jgi:hypothetical protein
MFVRNPRSQAAANLPVVVVPDQSPQLDKITNQHACFHRWWSSAHDAANTATSADVTTVTATEWVLS